MHNQEQERCVVCGLTTDVAKKEAYGPYPLCGHCRSTVAVHPSSRFIIFLLLEVRRLAESIKRDDPEEIFHILEALGELSSAMDKPKEEQKPAPKKKVKKKSDEEASSD